MQVLGVQHTVELASMGRVRLALISLLEIVECTNFFSGASSRHKTSSTYNIRPTRFRAKGMSCKNAEKTQADASSHGNLIRHAHNHRTDHDTRA